MNLGIDFGSTYSTISTYNATTGRAEAIALVEGESASIPSVVSIFGKSQKISCGKAAKEQIGKKSARIFEAFKMLLNEDNQEMLRKRGYDSTYTPHWAAKTYLSSLVGGAMKRCNAALLENVVVCVPEIWCRGVRSLDGRSILRGILENELDLELEAKPKVRVTTEPEAASAFFAYNYRQETQKPFNGHLLLIDYGGGTLDITLTEVRSYDNGSMEIAYREGGGAGENHPDEQGNGTIGNAGIAYMQRVVELALREAGMLDEGAQPDYMDPEFLAAVKDLESQLKSAERIQDIEDTFGSYGSGYQDIEDILNDNSEEFCGIEYEEEEVSVTYQQLFQAYRMTIEPVLDEQIRRINPLVEQHIHMDPCDPMTGIRDDFKIALVGGYGSFYLVKKQISDIYKLDANPRLGRNMAADKREQAISLGAALLAEGKVKLQKTARYSIGLCTQDNTGRKHICYGIHYLQTVKTGKVYFLCYDNDPSKPRTYAYPQLDCFMIGDLRKEDRNGHGWEYGTGMRPKPDILKRLRSLPDDGMWYIGFSMDENDIVSLHLVPRSTMSDAKCKEITVPLDSYRNMFEMQEVREIFVPEGENA